MKPTIKSMYMAGDSYETIDKEFHMGHTNITRIIRRLLRCNYLSTKDIPKMFENLKKLHIKYDRLKDYTSRRERVIEQRAHYITKRIAYIKKYVNG